MCKKTGILLVNLGSPDAPTPRAVRKYLFQFLHDRRVIELTRWLWCPILHGIILRTRPRKTARAYQSIWGKDQAGNWESEAPLVKITRQQAELLAPAFPGALVRHAMRYGRPSINDEMDALKGAGCDQIVIVPLYPQYAGATTASVYDEVAKTIKKWRHVPKITFAGSYPEFPPYIEAIIDSMKEHLGALTWTPDQILVSFHGLPKSVVDDGDPYADECKLTFEAMCQAAPELPLALTFQSRFGPKEWLSPYTAVRLGELPDEGIKKIAVIAPGFTADCLETMEEISIEGKEIFEEAGGTHFTFVPCLNTHSEHIEMLEQFINPLL